MDNEQKSTIEFLKQEYTGIAQAFGDLYNVILKVFNFYLFIAAVPFTVAAIIFKSPESRLDLWVLPFSISALLLLVSFIGLFTTFSIIHLRMEQILYAKTINCIRRFFWESGVNIEKRIDNYFNLPITDELPPFLELWRSFFWQIIMIGIIDGAYIWAALINLTCLPPWCVSFLSFGYFLFHISIYVGGALIRKSRYKVKCLAAPGRLENY